MQRETQDLSPNIEYKKEFQKYYNEYPTVKKKRGRSEITRALRWIEPWEKEWGVDLCYQNDEQKLQKMADLSSKNARIYVLYILHEYIKWCQMTKVPHASSKLLDITTPEIERIKSKTVSSPAQLQNYLNILYRAESERTIDNTYRALFWIAFSGIKEKEAYQLTSDDVNLDEMFIEYGGMKFAIYKEGVAALSSCKFDKTIIYAHETYGSGSTELARAPGNNLLRGIRVAPNLDNRTMRIKISAKHSEAIKSGKIKQKLPYQWAWKSGLFYRELENELHGCGMSFDDVADQLLEYGPRAYQDGKEIASIEQKRSRMISELTREYRLWRMAHNI